MTKQDMIKRMADLATQMQALVAQFDLTPKKEFNNDPTFMIDLPSSGGGGGYPKFSGNPVDPADPIAADLQRRWLAIATQLVKLIANPHISKDDINAVFMGIGMLGGLYIEKHKS